MDHSYMKSSVKIHLETESHNHALTSLTMHVAQLCAGVSLQLPQHCNGDSGGPLVLNDFFTAVQV